MPWPIRPAPATKTRSIVTESPLSPRSREGDPPRHMDPGDGRPPRPACRPSPRGGSGRGGDPGADRRRWPRPAPRRAPGEPGPNLPRAPPLPARCRSSAASSSGTPAPVAAVVIITSGRLGRGRAASESRPAVATSIARSWAAVRCAPGLSPLLTTTRSATSSRPALMAWISSPISGASRTTVVSAAAATSTSLCPVPTVSMRIRSKPAASSTAAAAVEVDARPPACPRDAIERMKTSSSAACACMRTRSPSSAPPVIGLDGSTAMTATVRPTRRTSTIKAATSVDLPDPGGPVIPTRCARPAVGYNRRSAASPTADRFSTAVRRRASASRSPSTAALASSTARAVASAI